MPGTFIDIEIAASLTRDAELARKLAEVCPVDIFRAGDGGVELVQRNLDECVLCQLCINAAPAGALRVVKLYSGESLPSA